MEDEIARLNEPLDQGIVIQTLDSGDTKILGLG